MKASKFMFALSVVATSAGLLLSSCNMFNNEIKNLSQNTNDTNTNQSGYVDKGIKFNPSKTYGTMKDNDGIVYKTITIGTQTWMAENLATTHYRNGDAIVAENSCEKWKVDTTGLQCVYNDAATPGKWGRLYNWYAANDPRKIAPKGWHIPTVAEWKSLRAYATQHCAKPGNDESAAKFLCATNEWNSALGTDNGSGFTALPAGQKTPAVGDAKNLNILNYALQGSTTVFWSDNTTYAAWGTNTFHIDDYTPSGYVEMGTTIDGLDYKLQGYSIRLIKD
jgi:uncharacterized protein (TIGR02145 family)